MSLDIQFRWHGCPKCKPNNRDDSTKGRSLNQKLKHTEKMEQYVKDQGYNLVVMWECQWKQYKTINTVHNRYLYPTESRYRMSESTIIEEIKQGKVFGAVEVGVQFYNN